MKFLNRHHKKLEDALKIAYFQKEETEIELSSRWQMDVMRDIRRLGPLNAKNMSFLFLDRFVWRFATAACTVALMLLVYAGFTGWNPVDEVTTQFLDNPVEFTVAQAFGEYESYE